jgi:hypothetical protein
MAREASAPEAESIIRRFFSDPKPGASEGPGFFVAVA